MLESQQKMFPSSQQPLDEGNAPILEGLAHWVGVGAWCSHGATLLGNYSPQRDPHKKSLDN